MISPSLPRGRPFHWILDSEQSEEQEAGDPWWDKSWDSFIDWLKSDSNIYWISGKAGSGKSTLVKFIVSDSQTLDILNIWKPDPLITSHFF